MDPIAEGASGVAVEDIQERLVRIGYEIAEDERKESIFGESTANAVARFRLDQELGLGKEVDAITWSHLVDECYELGDRTLYLRLPNFHGKDVRQLQERLNILGFSCGTIDGQYGPFTEAAVKQFQESVGELGDGMAFQETFDAIERLHHVWAGKPASGPHPEGYIGFARAANVLESTVIAITGEDPIARNVAGRVWNLAGATTEQSGLELVDSPKKASSDAQVVLVLSYNAKSKRSGAMITLSDPESFPVRLRTAIQSSRKKPPLIRIEIPAASQQDSFTVSDAQTYAVLLLDAICGAFAS